MQIKPALDMTGYQGFSTLSLSDGRILDMLIVLHGGKEPYIVDCTHGRGTIWKESSFRPDIKIDAQDLEGVDYVCNNTDMSSVLDDNIVDVLVYDPPHVPKGAETGTVGYKEAYGISLAPNSNHVAALFPPFLREAARVVKDGGIILCKIPDIKRSGVFRWQSGWFVQTAQQHGFYIKDMAVKHTPGLAAMASSRWKNQHHLRNVHCFWICMKRGTVDYEWELGLEEEKYVNVD